MTQNEWKPVQVFQCPDCGAWVKNMHETYDHICEYKKASKEIGEKLKLLSEIGNLMSELKTIPFYRFTARRDIKSKIRLLNIKRLYGR